MYSTFIYLRFYNTRTNKFYEHVLNTYKHKCSYKFYAIKLYANKFAIKNYQLTIPSALLIPY